MLCLQSSVSVCAGVSFKEQAFHLYPAGFIDQLNFESFIMWDISPVVDKYSK